MRNNRMEMRLKKAEDILRPKRLRIIDFIRRIPRQNNQQAVSPRDTAEKLVKVAEATYDELRSQFNLLADLLAAQAVKTQQEIAHELMWMLRTANHVIAPDWNDVNPQVDSSALEQVQLGDLTSDPILLGLYHELRTHGTDPVIALKASLLCTQDFRARARLSVRFLDAMTLDLRRHVLGCWPRDEDTEYAMRLIFEDQLRDEMISPSDRTPQILDDE